MKEENLRGINVHETISDGYGNYITIYKNPPETSSVMIKDYYDKFIFDESDKAKNRLIEIVDLYVIPSKRRKHIGSGLLKKVIEYYPDCDILASIGMMQKHHKEMLNSVLREEGLRQLKLFFESNGFIDVNNHFKSYQHNCSYMYKKDNTTKRLTSKSIAEIKRDISENLPKYATIEDVEVYNGISGLAIRSHSKCNNRIISYCSTYEELPFLSTKQAKKISIIFDNNSKFDEINEMVNKEYTFSQYIEGDTDNHGVYIPDISYIENDSAPNDFDLILTTTANGNGRFSISSEDEALKNVVDNGIKIDLVFIPFISKEEKLKEDEESNKLKKHIIIKTNSNEEMHYMGNCIYEQLVGNQDYIDSRIVLSMEPDGEETKNEIHVLVFNDSKSNPEIII